MQIIIIITIIIIIIIIICVMQLPIPNIYFLRMTSKFTGLLIPLRTAIYFSQTSTQYQVGALLTVWNLTSVKPGLYHSPGKPTHWPMTTLYVNPP
jgi:hypothetical protein